MSGSDASTSLATRKNSEKRLIFSDFLVLTVSSYLILIYEVTSKSFTVESAGFLRPVADTYISESNKTGVFGTADTLYIDNQRTYLATFKTSEFEGANKAYFNIPLTGSGSQTISVYVLDGFSVNEKSTCYNNTPARTAENLISTYEVSEGDNQLDLLGIVAKAKSDYFTIAVSGSAHYFEENYNKDISLKLGMYAILGGKKL